MNATFARPSVLACPFRPFFLLAGLFGAASAAIWVAQLRGVLPMPAGISPLWWHAHEMLFGLGGAAIAGFLLTAMSNWTGTAALAGGPLGALVGLWAAGRVAMALIGVLPTWLVAAIDLAFLPAVAGYAAAVIGRHGNRRNYVLVAVLAVLVAANAAMHAAFLGHGPGLARLGEVLALDVLAVLMLVIGGRITPAFSANWLRLQGADPAGVARSEWLDRAGMVTALAMLPADATGIGWLIALAAAAAAVANGLRLVGWRGWRVRGEPMLWILHLGFLWVVLALCLKALAALDAGVPTSAWFHAMGAGAMGTLILGVMTRVAVGHTGRPLRLPRGAVTIYLLVLVAAALRTLVALGWLPQAAGGLMTAGLLWSAAFALFTVYYAPILWRPRADGQPG